jgi:branched-chain amino acid transport system ATP-binding protein
MPEAALELEKITLTYGGLVALASVDLALAEGSVTGLIGPNGAGKTSLFDVVTGLVRPNSGRVILHGKDITRARPSKRARLGIARTYQRLELFASLTVAENVAVAAETAERLRLRPRRWGLFSSGARECVAAQLQRTGLEDQASRRVDTLPTGTARLVEVARALASEPRVLLLDEPTSGLSHSETDRLAGLISELAARGLAVLLVEHDVELVMRICGQVYVLDRGSVLARGTPAEVRANAAVRDAYLGRMALS